VSKYIIHQAEPVTVCCQYRSVKFDIALNKTEISANFCASAIMVLKENILFAFLAKVKFFCPYL